MSIPAADARPPGWRLALVLLAGLVARAALLPSHGVWLDEALSIRDARMLGGGSFAEDLTHEVGCPLYLVLLRLWMGVFGSTSLAGSLLSVLCSSLVPWFVFGTADRWFGRRAAWWAVLLAVLNTQSLQYSVEIRWYALLELLTAASWYLLARVPDQPRLVWWYLAVGVAGLYTHLYFALVLVSQVLVVARAFPTLLRRVWPAWLGMGVVFLPWVPILQQQPHPWSGMLATLPDWWSVFDTFCLTIADKLAPQPEVRSILTPVVMGAVLVGTGWRLARLRTLSASARLAWLMGVSYGVAVGLPILASHWAPVFIMRRYDMVALMPLELLLGWALSHLYRPLQAMALVATLLATVQYSVHLTDHLDTDRQVVATLRPMVAPSDIIIYTGLSRLAPEYYLDQFGVQYAAHYMVPGDLESHPSWVRPDQYQEEELEGEVAQLTDRILQQPFVHVIVFYNSPDSHSPGQLELGQSYVLLRAVLEQRLKLQQTIPAPQHPEGPFYDEVLIYGRR